MIYSIGSMKNLPSDFNLNSIPDYFKKNVFTTSVGFRCYYPSIINNYPIEEKGILYINKLGNMLKMYYFCKNATYVSVGVYIGNTVRKIDWYQVVDSRHTSIYDRNNSAKKLVSDNNIKQIIDTFITKYDDSELWRMIEPKFKKEHWNGYTNKNNPHIWRKNAVIINTNNGLIVKGSNVVISKNRGLSVQSPSGSSIRSWVTDPQVLYGVQQKSVTAINSDRKLLIQSRNRPIVQSNDAGGGNREIVIRSDVRWKQMYNGRQGLRSISYPANAREVIVQLYTDVGGRNYRAMHPHPAYRLGLLPYGKTDGYFWEDIYPPNFQIGGEVVNGVIGRDRGYKEYAPMHFIKGLYNRINQDAAFIEHRSDCTITLNSIGYDNIVNNRSLSAAVHDFNPLNQDMTIVDERYGFATNRNRIIPGQVRNPRRGQIIKDLAISVNRRDNYWPMNIISESVWRNNSNLANPVYDIPYIRRVWWR